MGIKTIDYSPFCFREALIAASTTLTRCCGGGCVSCDDLRDVGGVVVCLLTEAGSREETCSRPLVS